MENTEGPRPHFWEHVLKEARREGQDADINQRLKGEEPENEGPEKSRASHRNPIISVLFYIAWRT